MCQDSNVKLSKTPNLQNALATLIYSFVLWYSLDYTTTCYFFLRIYLIHSKKGEYSLNEKLFDILL